jgi:S1-C subfamily serine protease
MAVPAIADIPTGAVIHENTVAEVAERLAPSVVSLEISAQGKRSVPSISDSFDFRGKKVYKVVPRVTDVEAKIGDGSGFIISQDGYIVTNQHVISPQVNGRKVKPSKIEVVLYDGQRYEATVTGEDEDTDIAVLKIKASGLKPIEWGDSASLRPGEFGITIGSSLGADHTVGFGIISAVSRKKPQGSKEALFGDLEYIQTYAQINPGNSGGPLLNIKGDVIGITSFIQIAPHSPGFAIPSNYAKKIVTALIKDGKVRRPAVGIYITTKPPNIFAIDEESELVGAYVREVMDGGPADKAGIKAGDFIVKINSKEIKQPQEFTREIRSNQVGTTFDLIVIRDEKTINLKVKSAFLD